MRTQKLGWIAVGMLALGLANSLGAQAPPSPAAPAAPEPRVSGELISSVDALLLVTGSVAACAARGEKAAAFVTDTDNHLRAALSSDGMHPIGIASAGRKTATVLAFGASTRVLRERLTTDPAFAAGPGKDPRYYFSPGGLPLYRGGKLVAVLAVGGGHALDEACALDALKAVPWATTTP